jgi:hypothetical protein
MRRAKRSVFESRGTLLRAFYYTAMIEGSGIFICSLIDWLDYDGCTVVIKPRSSSMPVADSRSKAMNIELTVKRHGVGCAR